MNARISQTRLQVKRGTLGFAALGNFSCDISLIPISKQVMVLFSEPAGCGSFSILDVKSKIALQVFYFQFFYRKRMIYFFVNY